MTGTQAGASLCEKPMNFFVLPRTTIANGFVITDGLVWAIDDVPRQESKSLGATPGVEPLGNSIDITVVPIKPERFQKYFETLVDENLSNMRYSRRNRVLGEWNTNPKLNTPLREFNDNTIDAFVSGLDTWHEASRRTAVAVLPLPAQAMTRWLTRSASMISFCCGDGTNGPVMARSRTPVRRQCTPAL